MEIKELFNILKKLAPSLSGQELSVPDTSTSQADISNIGICVDPTAENIENAVNLGIEVLISYHPWQGEAEEIVKSRPVKIWPLHEAWDNAAMGVVHTFASEVGITEVYPKDELIIGVLETGFRELIERCQRLLGQNILSYSGDLRQPVAKVAIWAGPGFLPIYKKFWELSLAEGCDTILSNELTLSALRYSRAHHLKLLDLGHSSMAKPAMINLGTLLKEQAQDCSIHFLDDFYTSAYYTNCSFADQFTESEDIFFETEP
jgi:putative NIF3 family GTP cyclohydrolase 1 type 2